MGKEIAMTVMTEGRKTSFAEEGSISEILSANVRETLLMCISSNGCFFDGNPNNGFFLRF
jgi:hypothetical protein